jgi:hypothetical protein
MLSSFFARIDKAAHREQVLQVAEQLKDNPPLRAATPPPRRPVGRPAIKRTAEQALISAAAADAVIEQCRAATPNKRGTYTRWFSSPYINDILVAYSRSGGSARRAVQSLRESAPDDRYTRLSHSTVSSWFEDGQLKQQHKQELAAGQASSTSGGRCAVLQSVAGAEDSLCNILLKLRQAGTPLNSHVIRWVMLGVLDGSEQGRAALQTLTLSQTYISRFVRTNPRLHFRWRARTTAASKLPDDWEDQGIRMAQRLGATMQLHKVSTHRTDKDCDRQEAVCPLSFPAPLIHPYHLLPPHTSDASCCCYSLLFRENCNLVAWSCLLPSLTCHFAFPECTLGQPQSLTCLPDFYRASHRAHSPVK